MPSGVPLPTRMRFETGKGASASNRVSANAPASETAAVAIRKLLRVRGSGVEADSGNASRVRLAISQVIVADQANVALQSMQRAKARQDPGQRTKPLLTV